MYYVSMNTKSILIFVLVLVLIFGGFLIYKNSTKIAKQPIDNETSETTIITGNTIINKDWITYQNTTYKYSIKYPSNFTAQNNGADVGITEARADSRSLYIYNKLSKDTYLERYVDLEVFQVDTSSSRATQVELNGIKMKKEPSSEGALFSVYIVPLKTEDYLQIYVTNDASRKDVALAILSTFNLN